MINICSDIFSGHFSSIQCCLLSSFGRCVPLRPESSSGPYFQPDRAVRNLIISVGRNARVSSVFPNRPVITSWECDNCREFVGGLTWGEYPAELVQDCYTDELDGGWNRG